MSEDARRPLTDPELVPNPSVLVVEDDPAVAQMLRRFIERQGMKVQWASTGAEAARLKESMRPDIVLVDLTLPDVDGKQLVRMFANQRDCGVIVVSGRADEVDRVVGIELGADDYVTKPPLMNELMARIRAVHRRSVRANAAQAQPAEVVAPPAPAVALAAVTLGSVRVDLRRRVVLSAAGVPIHLTAAEFSALEQLVVAAPHPVARETLCTTALRRPFHAEDRGVDQLILSLRRKLFADEAGQSVIVSVRGQGYAIAADRELLAQ